MAARIEIAVDVIAVNGTGTVIVVVIVIVIVIPNRTAAAQITMMTVTDVRNARGARIVIADANGIANHAQDAAGHVVEETAMNTIATADDAPIVAAMTGVVMKGAMNRNGIAESGAVGSAAVVSAHM